jgi:hypothetical protein
VTIQDKQAAEEVAREIEALRTLRREGWITLHVPKDGPPASIEVKMKKGLQLGK